MIENLGVGIDIIEVSRFKKKKYEENINFYKKIFVKS
jgi:phosphopantetheinyl transferase (holo-ACP synthase)